MNPGILSTMRSAALAAQWVSERIPVAQLSVVAWVALWLTLPEKHLW